MKTFTLNGKTYQTDTETMRVLQSVMPGAKATGDSSAVIAMIELGKMTGRITEVIQKVYGMVHPDIKSVQFSFNATDDKDAEGKAFRWNRYHSFTGASMFTFKELDPQSTEASWLHNEWMS